MRIRVVIRVNDSAIRQRALKPECSFIVQAPAGSGKTALLVYRMLRVLATVDYPEQVLAITFTRKATAEMRERLIEQLREAEQGVQYTDSFKQQGIELAQQVLSRDQELDWRLLDSPERLQIHTIDALSSKISGDMPWLSHLGSRPVTVDNAVSLYGAAVDALMIELLAENETDVTDALKSVLLELDFNYARARQLFISMLAKRDQWLRYLVQNDLPAFRTGLESAWRSLIEESVRKLQEAFPVALLQQLVDIANQAALDIPESKPQLNAFKHTPLESESQLSVPHWQDLAYLLTVSGAKAFRATVDVRTGFPASNKDRKQAMLAILAALEGDENLLFELQNFVALPTSGFVEEEWQQLLALEKVLLRLAVLLQLEFRQRNQCDFNEVSQRAIRALSELDQPTDLALRLDYRLSHILVDEFQDTSRGQMGLLRCLTAGWQVDDGRSLFLVGDPMQSIYRFREADVSLFMQVAENEKTAIFSNLHIQPLSLSENFRSNKVLVDWFNRVFESSFPKENSILNAAIKYAPSSSNKEHSGRVISHLVESREQEAQEVVAHIRMFLAQQASGEIAVLVKSRTHLPHIIQVLEAEGINYLGVDIKPLAEVPAVQDLVTLAKAICRPENRLACFSLMRSPFLGLTLTEIQALGDGDLVTMLNSAKFEDETQVRVNRFLKIISSALEQRQQTTLNEIVRWAFTHLGGRFLQGEASDEDVQSVFKLIAENEVGGDIVSFSEIENKVSELYAKPKNQEGARVLLSTIHKAKGLQYKSVILPSLDRQPPSDRKDILMWSERINQAGESQLLLAPITDKPETGKHYEYLRRLDSERAKQERIRLMYVACTRAEEEIILLANALFDKNGDLSAPPKNSLLATIWGETELDFNLVEGGIESNVENEDQFLQRLPTEFDLALGEDVSWQGVESTLENAEESDSLEFEWATELAQGVGIVLHSWLEHHCDQLWSIQIDESLKQHWQVQLQALRVPDHRVPMGVRRLQEALDKMRVDPHADYLFNNHQEAENELELTSFESNKLKKYKIDRTFVDEGTRWIVDYKTTTTLQDDTNAFVDSQVQARHQQQLEHYGFLMSKIDSRPIKLAVYFPLLGELRAWDYHP